jgi:deoxyinosine 3'endonuclease (endonuclease V)
MKWRETLTDEMESNTDYHLSVFLSISSVGVALHFICQCFSPFHLSVFLSISSVGVALRQMKWRETPTDEMERNTDIKLPATPTDEMESNTDR